MVAELRSAVDTWASTDPAELSEHALAADLLALRAQIDRLEAVFARFAVRAHRLGVGATDGAQSTAAFLRWKAGMREGDARAAIEAGEVSELLTDTGAAWRDGEISSGAARTIIGARAGGHDDELVACEPVLLDLARRGDMRYLRRAARHFRNLALADGSEPGARDGMSISQTFDGVTVFSGELSDAAAETVVTAIHAYTDPPSDDDPRTTAQRTAAALVQIARVALEHSRDVGRAPTQVSVVLDWSTLTEGRLGRLDGTFTGPIHRDDVRRLLCDANVSRIVTGPDSLPLDVGRSRRTIPPGLRRAVIARDTGCIFPGCDRPPGWCEIHHTRHWVDGGETAIDNLNLFCDRHHHVIHQPGWTVTFVGQVLRVFRPDGTEVTAHRSRQPTHHETRSPFRQESNDDQLALA